jgi:5'-methylthioadenosine phosphorylase
MPTSIPAANYSLIGGSGTWGARFPEDLELADVELIELFDGFETPYGTSAPFKLLHILGQPVLRTAMHGIPYSPDGAPRAPIWVAAKQVAWVLQQAGVSYALVEGSVGGIQSPGTPGQPLPPWSVVITDDHMMFFRPHDDLPFHADRKEAARFKDPFCGALRSALYDAAVKEPKFASVHNEGVYVTGITGRFETAAEIKAFGALGAHVVGLTLSHEAIVLRRLGVHLGSLNIVSNYAEGMDEWIGENDDAMTDFYFECPKYVGPVMVEALRTIIQNGPGPCNCDSYRLRGLNQFPVPGA